MIKTKSPAKKSPFGRFNFAFGGTGLAARALLARHLALMLKAGITITETLEIAEESAVGQMKKIIADLSRSVTGGETLAAALGRHPKIFSGLFINSVKAGESSGTLAGSLAHLADRLERERELKMKIQSAMIYPLVVLSATALLGLTLAFWILPKITPLFAGLKVDLPLTTKALLAVSAAISNHGSIIALVLLLVIAGLILFFKLPLFRPATDWLWLNLPLVKRIVRAANLSRLAGTLSTLIKSGLPIHEALGIAGQAAGNLYYTGQVTAVRQAISQGQSLADSFSQAGNLFPNLFIKMVKVGEESGQFEETLLYLSSFYESEVDRLTKQLSTAMEPILLLIIGLVVGGLALSIITPIYEITGNIRR